MQKFDKIKRADILHTGDQFPVWDCELELMERTRGGWSEPGKKETVIPCHHPWSARNEKNTDLRKYLDQADASSHYTYESVCDLIQEDACQPKTKY